MTRAERLIALIRLLKRQKPLTMQELCKKCGVSERSMYRDLRTLGELGFPVSYDNGYRLNSNKPTL
jgi:predicted DNA-binding transcriptional regulator YafY